MSKNAKVESLNEYNQRVQAQIEQAKKLKEGKQIDEKQYEEGQDPDSLKALIKQLNGKVEEMGKQLGMYKVWQEGDKYLRKDVFINEVIEDQEIRLT